MAIRNRAPLSLPLRHAIEFSVVVSANEGISLFFSSFFRVGAGKGLRWLGYPIIATAHDPRWRQGEDIPLLPSVAN